MERSKLKTLIPHGKMKEVAKRAGVSKEAVSKFLSGAIKDSPKIYQAALEVANEVQSPIQEAESKLKQDYNFCPHCGHPLK